MDGVFARMVPERRSSAATGAGELSVVATSDVFQMEVPINLLTSPTSHTDLL
jgi:hypothetical protein